MEQVLQLPELLEAILSYLPPLELLIIQRTARSWHDLISTSPLLQKLLFMRPDWKLQGHYANDKPGARPLNNLMLRKIMGGMYPTMTLQLLNFDNEEHFRRAKNHLDNLGVSTWEPDDNNSHGSIATEEEGKENETLSLDFWAWNVNVSFPADELLSVQSGRPAVAHEKASWRRMFVSQPPATSLHLTRRWRRSERPAIVVETGITMQDLVMAASESDAPRWNQVFIGSDRDWHLEGPIKYSHFTQEKRKIRAAP